MGHITPNKQNLITPEVILTNFLYGIDIIIANLPDISKIKATYPILNHHEQTLHNIVRLIYLLHNVQPTGIVYILANTPSSKLHSHIQQWLTPNNTLNAPHAVPQLIERHTYARI